MPSHLTFAMIPQLLLLSALFSQLLLIQARPHRPHRTANAHSNSLVCGINFDDAQVARFGQRFREMRPLPDLFRGPDDTDPAVIDVHWHIIAANRTAQGGWIQSHAIHEQMQVLNDTYKETGFQFHYAGTQRIVNQKYFSGLNPNLTLDDPVWHEFASLYRIGGPEALNIYTLEVPLPTIGIGIPPAFYPELQEAGAEYIDGILLHHGSLPGGYIPGHNQGKNLVHEVGHWLGLWHIFQGGCDEPGDEVADTAPQLQGFGNCTFTPSCGVAPTPNNYMDYNTENCVSSFTPGQMERMREQTRAFRGIAV